MNNLASGKNSKFSLWLWFRCVGVGVILVLGLGSTACGTTQVNAVPAQNTPVANVLTESPSTDSPSTQNAPTKNPPTNTAPAHNTPVSGVPGDLDYSTTRDSEKGLYRATIKFDTGSIPINRLHTWTLHVETPDGKPVENAEITLDGDMPEHGHGMGAKPQVTEYLGNGDYRVEGMKFQMGGWWVIDFMVNQNGVSDKVSFNLMLQG